MKVFDFEKICSAFGDAPALIQHQSISYNKYIRVINNTIQKLESYNIFPKERVAVYSQNTIYYPIILLALMKLEAIAVPVCNSLPANKVAEMLASINCKKIILDNNSNLFSPNNFETILTVHQLVHLDSAEEIKSSNRSISFDQDATIIFTSGSSGNPKAVLHTFGNHYYSSLGSNENIPFAPGDRWLLSLPFYHVGGLSLIFRSLISGATTVISNKNTNLISNINNFGITHISLVTTQLFRLLHQEDSINILRKLKCILIGGSSIPSELIRKSIQNNLPVFTTYGSTEMASQITTTKPNEKSEKLFTSGKLLEYRKIKIAEDGEILVKGDTLFKGYIEHEKIIKPFDCNGWFQTGDLGKIDVNGYLTVSGRKDNMFISGGENIHPEEIEKALLNIPQIAQALVLDITDDEFGARLAAFIELSPPNSIGTEKIYDFLSTSLPRFMIPVAFYQWPNDDKGLKPDRVFFKNLIKNSEAVKI